MSDISPAPTRESSPAWRRLRWLLVGIFACHGLVVLCVLPPFEGWDEYQHVAYVDLMSQGGASPDSRHAVISKEFLTALTAFPQSARGAEQLQSIGVRTYREWWSSHDAPVAPQETQPIPLYEMQQTSLYYRLAAPFYSLCGGVRDLRVSVCVLRLMNLALGALALWVVLGALVAICGAELHATIVAILVAVQPMFVMATARVANDALALLLGSVAVALLLRAAERRAHLYDIVAGLVSGLAIVAKSVNLALLPFAAVAVVIPAIHRRASHRESIGRAVLVAGSALATTLAFSLLTTGRFEMVPPIVEEVTNQTAGRGIRHLLSAAVQLDWFHDLRRLWLHDAFWVGGWSYLKPSDLTRRAFEIAIVVCVLGLAIACVSRRSRERSVVFRDATDSAKLVALVLSFAAALAYHMVQSQAARGRVLTNAWYAALAWPWILALGYRGAMALPGAVVRAAVPCAFLTIFVATDVIGSFRRMLPTYTGLPFGSRAFERMASLQPWFLGTVTLATASLVAVGLSCAAAVLFAKIVRTNAGTAARA
jgi:predicted membrane protein DUF2142